MTDILHARRHFLSGCAVTLLAAATGTAAHAAELIPIEGPKLTLVMNLVVTCTDPEKVGGGPASKDGQRTEIWPIVGGRFEGLGIRGTVIPGGGDFPVTRPDGIEVIDALYRLKTDDGVQIIIHNRGLVYTPTAEQPYRFRLVPEFIAPVGKYDWLNKAIFLSTLVEVPKEMQLAGPGENDRLIQVYRVD